MPDANSSKRNDPFSPVRSWADEVREAALRVEHWRLTEGLLGDYQRDYDPVEVSAWQDETAGNIIYGPPTPVYSTSAEATASAARCADELRSISRRRKELPAEQESVRQRLETARARLHRTWPWQRARRSTLQDDIEQAEFEMNALDHEAWYLDESEIDNGNLSRHADWAAKSLARWEHSRRAATNAATRTLGWQPGDPLPPPRETFRAAPGGIVTPPARTVAPLTARASRPSPAWPGPGNWSGHVARPPDAPRSGGPAPRH